MNSTEKFSNRDFGLEFFKATATLLVIIGHVIQFTDINFDNSLIFRIIYAFHMPLFMCISGYLTPAKTPSNFLKNKFLQLVIPFILWSIIIIIIHPKSRGNEFNLITCTENIFQIFLAPENTLWFLWVLFLNFSAFKILEGKYRLEVSLALILTLYALQYVDTQFNNFGLNLFRWHYTFFLLGFLLQQRKKSSLTKIKLYLIIVITSIALAYWDRNLVTTLINIEIKSILIAKIATLAIKYIAAIGIIIIIFHYKNSFNYHNRAISFLANQSLGFYAIQTVLFIPAVKIWAKYNISSQLILFLFITTISSIMIYLLDKSPTTRQLFLGKLNYRTKNL